MLVIDAAQPNFVIGIVMLDDQCRILFAQAVERA